MIFFFTLLWISAAAKGKQRMPHFCITCGKSFGYGYSLRNHIARSSQCQIALQPMPVELTFLSGKPPAPFGTREYFTFCENVPLKCGFTFAEWQGPHANQAHHLGYLLRHGVPLIWKYGAKHCDGLKVPKINPRKGFTEEVRRLLKPSNLVEPNVEIEVKSAKIGKVTDN